MTDTERQTTRENANNTPKRRWFPRGKTELEKLEEKKSVLAAEKQILKDEEEIAKLREGLEVRSKKEKEEKAKYDEENPWYTRRTLNTVGKAWKAVWSWIWKVWKGAWSAVKWTAWWIWALSKKLWTWAKTLWKVATSPVWGPAYWAYKWVELIWKWIPPVRWAANGLLSAERGLINGLKSPFQLWSKAPKLLWWWIWKYFDEAIWNNLKVEYMKAGKIWTTWWFKRWANRLIALERLAVGIAQTPIWITRRVPWLKWTWKVNDWLEKLKMKQFDTNGNAANDDFNLTKTDIWKDFKSIFTWKPANSDNYSDNKTWTDG